MRLFEKSTFPRHKVCGEFLSPEIQPELEALQVWKEFQNAGPATIRSVLLHFGHREKGWRLHAPAFGLSRYTLDRILVDCAVARGAELIHEPFQDATILAYGRKAAAPKGNRLFGFKAHFTGPSNDMVELFFESRGYAGVSAIENGATNVCGLAPESSLAAYGFDIDRFISRWSALRSRLSPLTRITEWLMTGPLVFSRDFNQSQYAAGDALGFVDPFTGSGILSAVLTGRRAGSAAARGVPNRDYVKQCSALLRFPYWASSLARFAILTGLADDLARWLPGRLLFSLTRPHQALK